MSRNRCLPFLTWCSGPPRKFQAAKGQIVLVIRWMWKLFRFIISDSQMLVIVQRSIYSIVFFPHEHGHFQWCFLSRHVWKRQPPNSPAVGCQESPLLGRTMLQRRGHRTKRWHSQLHHHRNHRNHHLFFEKIREFFRFLMVSFTFLTNNPTYKVERSSSESRYP